MLAWLGSAEGLFRQLAHRGLVQASRHRQALVLLEGAQRVLRARAGGAIGGAHIVAQLVEALCACFMLRRTLVLAPGAEVWLGAAAPSTPRRPPPPRPWPLTDCAL